MIAWNRCSFDAQSNPIQPTFECWYAEYEACMDFYASAVVKKPAIGDRREVLLASRPAAPRL